MDVAVLFIPNLPGAAPYLPLDPRRVPRRGDRVLAVGHALFAPRSGLRESVTKGVISQASWPRPLLP